MERPTTPQEQLRREILGSHDALWTPDDLRDHPGLAEELREAGELQQVAPGWYWRPRLSPRGHRVLDPLALTKALLPTGAPLGAAQIDATRHFGLVARSAGANYYAVGVMPPITPHRIFYVDRSDRKNRRGLTYDEVTYLEVLEWWPRGVEVPHDQGRRIMREVLEGEKIRGEVIATAALFEPEASRRLLEQILKA